MKKNIFLVQTDKPSRLHITGTLKLYPNGLSPKPQGLCKNQHIYITDNEKIKEGDWYLVELFKITGESDGFYIEKCTKLDDVWCNNFDVISTRHKGNCKKIILTDDEDLIKNNVQEISEDFLEWFVKNPSCEYIETHSLDIKIINTGESFHYRYEILIPQEEPQRGFNISNEERLKEAAEMNCVCKRKDCVHYKSFTSGALSDAARDYWFEKFKNK